VRATGPLNSLSSLQTSSITNLDNSLDPTPKIAIVIPTRARPHVLAETLESLARQTLVPDQVIISATGPSDLPSRTTNLQNIETVFGPAGLCSQRNVARWYLRKGVELIFLLDDDLELAQDYLERMVNIFMSRPELGLLGGNMIAEGVSRAEAIQVLADVQPYDSSTIQVVRALYGCNMCVRTEILLAVEFDENLRLVGWLEDFDWSIRAGRYGAIMCTSSARVVHLKVASGRIAGYRFGYAQVINPLYLYRKGTIPSFHEVLDRHWLRLIAGNLVGLISRDKKIDRRGRLRGNLRAFCDICCGRVDPRRIELL